LPTSPGRHGSADGPQESCGHGILRREAVADAVIDLVRPQRRIAPGDEEPDVGARAVAGALATRGELLMYEEHPVAECVDGLLRWHHDYFDESVNEERLWRLGRVVTAVARARLRVEALEEYPGDTAWRRHDRRVPGSFLLYARREA